MEKWKEKERRRKRKRKEEERRKRREEDPNGNLRREETLAGSRSRARARGSTLSRRPRLEGEREKGAGPKRERKKERTQRETRAEKDEKEKDSKDQKDQKDEKERGRFPKSRGKSKTQKKRTCQKQKERKKHEERFDTKAKYKEKSTLESPVQANCAKSIDRIRARFRKPLRQTCCWAVAQAHQTAQKWTRRIPSALLRIDAGDSHELPSWVSCVCCSVPFLLCNVLVQQSLCMCGSCHRDPRARHTEAAGKAAAHRSLLHACLAKTMPWPCFELLVVPTTMEWTVLTQRASSQPSSKSSSSGGRTKHLSRYV